MSDTHTSSVFMNGRSQALRIPAACRFPEGARVSIKKQGDALVVVPIEKSWDAFFASTKASDDFMETRDQSSFEDREAL